MILATTCEIFRFFTDTHGKRSTVSSSAIHGRDLEEVLGQL